MLEFINEWIALIPTIVMCASLICAATPTPRDDEALAKVYKFLDWCALILGRLNKNEYAR